HLSEPDGLRKSGLGKENRREGNEPYQRRLHTPPQLSVAIMISLPVAFVEMLYCKSSDGWEYLLRLT
ncbi:MAG TPA: hypothetical protein DCP63_06655, partial [Bacteroidetes bacterium]|nr:hypothetical protein [Bacteroidota bacterium]